MHWQADRIRVVIALQSMHDRSDAGCSHHHDDQDVTDGIIMTLASAVEYITWGALSGLQADSDASSYSYSIPDAPMKKHTESSHWWDKAKDSHCSNKASHTTPFASSYREDDALSRLRAIHGGIEYVSHRTAAVQAARAYQLR